MDGHFEGLKGFWRAANGAWDAIQRLSDRVTGKTDWQWPSGSAATWGVELLEPRLMLDGQPQITSLTPVLVYGTTVSLCATLTDAEGCTAKVTWAPGVQEDMTIDATGLVAYARHTYANNSTCTISAELYDAQSAPMANLDVPYDFNVLDLVPTTMFAGATPEGDLYLLNLPANDDVAAWTISWGDGQVACIDNPSTAPISSAVHRYTDGPNSYTPWVGATFRDGSARSRSFGFDTSFDGDGKMYGGSVSALNSLAVQADGKIVVTLDGESNLLMRYNADGSVDHTFGSDRNGRVASSFENELAGPRLALQPDGKIVVAATCDGSSVLVARYKSDGSLDENFDGGGHAGWAIVDMSGEDWTSASVCAVCIQSDGHVAIIAAASVAGSREFAVVRFQGDGTPPAEPVVHGSSNLPGGGSYFVKNAVVCPDDSLLLGGYKSWNGSTYAALILCQADGELDQSHTFGDDLDSDTYKDGIALCDTAGTSVTSLLRDADTGLTYTVGTTSLLRWAADGTVTLCSGLLLTGASGIDKTTDGHLIIDGKFSNHFAITRVDLDGNVDAAFGSGGLLLPDLLTTTSSGSRIVVLMDGRFLAGGAISSPCSMMVLARGGPLLVQDVPAHLAVEGAFSAGPYEFETPAPDMSYTLWLHNSDPGSDVVTSWRIDWGDGTGPQDVVGSESSVTHTYTDMGNYTVTAWASDDDRTLQPASVVGGSLALDKTFDVDGAATGTAEGEVGRKVAVQSDGRLVTVEYEATGTSLHVVRYQPDGIPDAAFGTDGRMQITLPPDMGVTTASLALQADGMIVLAATLTDEERVASGYVWRLTTSGDIDPDFRQAGQTPITLQDGLYIQDVAVQPDGKILVGGYAIADSVQQVMVARLTANGELDDDVDSQGPLFGNGGIALIAAGDGNAGAKAILVEPTDDGCRIYAAGYAYRGSNRDFLAIGLTDRGVLDEDFHNHQPLLLDFGSTVETAQALALQYIGQTARILVAGQSTTAGGNNDFVVAAISPRGELDASFGTDGCVKTDLGGNDSLRAVAVLPNSDIVAAGQSCSNGSYALALAHYGPNGTLGPGRSDGVYLDRATSVEYGYGLAVDADGRVLVCGSREGYPAVWRYQFGLQVSVWPPTDVTAAPGDDGTIESGVGLGQPCLRADAGFHRGAQPRRQDWMDRDRPDRGPVIPGFLRSGCGRVLLLPHIRRRGWPDLGLEPARVGAAVLRRPERTDRRARHLRAPHSLSWSDISNEDGYQIEQAVGESPQDGDWYPIGTVDADVTTFDAPGPFDPQTTYNFRVRPLYGTAVYSNVAQVTTPAWPAAPDGLTADGWGTNRIHLSWSGCEEADAYRIQFSLDGEDWKPAGDDVTDCSCFHTELTDGTLYHYRVLAVNEEGESAFSQTAQAWTWPLAPSELHAELLNANAVHLTWDCDSQRVQGFVIEQHHNEPEWWTVLGWVDADIREFTVPGPFEGPSAYLFRVRSYISPGIYSEDAPLAQVFTPGYLDPPTGLLATTVEMTGVTLEWEAIAGLNVTYDLQKKLGDGQWDGIYTGGDTTCSEFFPQVEGLAIQYRVDVHANDGTYNYESPYSPPITVKTPLKAPIGPSATAVSATGIRLTWTDQSSCEAGFVVERSLDNSTWTSIGAAPASSGANGQVVWDAIGAYQPNTLYHFRVRAYSANWAVSDWVSASAISQDVPAAPSGVHQKGSTTNDITIAWSPVAGADSYIVEHLTAQGCWDVAAQGSNTDFMESDLSEASMHRYRVIAVKGSLRSTYSPECTAFTAPNPPIGLASIPDAQDGTYSLHWTDNSSGEAGYIVEYLQDDNGILLDTLPPMDGAVQAMTYDIPPVLAAGTTYTFRVSAFLGDQKSSSTVGLTTTNAPAMPSGLTATKNTSPDGIHLVWTFNGNANCFHLERSRADGAWESLDPVPATDRSLTDENVLSGAEYVYRIQAVNQYGSSAFFTSAALVYSVLPSGWEDREIDVPDGTGTATYTETETSHIFTVTGGGAGIGTQADSFHFAYKTPAITASSYITAKLSSTTAGGTDTLAGLMVRLGMGATAANAMIAYSPTDGVRFQYRESDGAMTTVATKVAACEEPYLRLECVKVLIGTLTYLEVHAYQSANNEDWWCVGAPVLLDDASFYLGMAVTGAPDDECQATYDDVHVAASTGLPEGPQDMKATVGNDQDIKGLVALSWDSFAGADSYTLRRGGGVIASGISDTTYADGWIDFATTYHYIVQPVSAYGTGPVSDEATAATLPFAPYNVSAIADADRSNYDTTAPGDGYIYLTWVTTDSAYTELQYRVDRDELVAGSWTASGSPGYVEAADYDQHSGSTQEMVYYYRDNNVTLGTASSPPGQYRYRVTAIRNSDNLESLASAAAVCTAMDVPAQDEYFLQDSSHSDDTVNPHWDLTWSILMGGQMYKLYRRVAGTQQWQLLRPPMGYDEYGNPPRFYSDPEYYGQQYPSYVPGTNYEYGLAVCNRAGDSPITGTTGDYTARESDDIYMEANSDNDYYWNNWLTEVDRQQADASPGLYVLATNEYPLGDAVSYIRVTMPFNWACVYDLGERFRFDYDHTKLQLWAVGQGPEWACAWLPDSTYWTAVGAGDELSPGVLGCCWDTMANRWVGNYPGSWIFAVEGQGLAEGQDGGTYEITLSDNGGTTTWTPRGSINVSLINPSISCNDQTISANNRDVDGDGVPGYADGFNWDRRSGDADDTEHNGVDESAFTAIHITLPAPIDVSRATLVIEYDSHRRERPESLTRAVTAGTGRGFAYALHEYPGHIRLWTNIGIETDIPRSMESFQSGRLQDGIGYYVPCLEPPFASPLDIAPWNLPQYNVPLSYSATELGFTASNRSVTLYAEGISEGEAPVYVSVDPDGTGPCGYFIANGTVNITVSEAQQTATYVRANDDDDDNDGIVDFADGFNLYPGTGPVNTSDDFNTAGTDFTAVPLNVPSSPNSSATFRLVYNASVPSSSGGWVTRQGDGTLSNPFRFVLGENTGALRVWAQQEASSSYNPRLAATLGAGGDYIASNATYLVSALPSGYTIYIEGLRANPDTNDKIIEVYFDPDGSGSVPELHVQTIRAIVVQPDLQADSNNSGQIDNTPREAEDQIENHDTSTLIDQPLTFKRPGLIVSLNEGDVDGDEIPDYADGYNLDSRTDGQAGLNASSDDVCAFTADGEEDPDFGRFVPIVLSLPEGIDLAQAGIQLVYEASDPAKVSIVAGGYLPEPSSTEHPRFFRLWTRPADTQDNRRTARPFYDKREGDEQDDQLGFYVPPTADGQWYSGQELGLLGFNDDTRQVTLYLEAVNPSPGLANHAIELRVKPDLFVDNSPVASDMLRVTILSGDLDIDSDNTSFGQPERDGFEDRIETSLRRPGKAVVVNDADADEDGIPNFADSSTNRGNLVPMLLSLPTWLLDTNAKFRLVYDGSDPAGATHVTGGGYLPAHGTDNQPGTLRVWRMANNSESYAYADPAQWYTPAELGLSGSNPAALRVEAVRGSKALADQLVQVQVDLDGDGQGGFVTLDAVRLTALEPVADADYREAVRLFDGSIATTADDFTTDGWGLPWGHSRTWSNQVALSLYGSINGNGVVIDQLPCLIQCTTAVMVIRGGQAEFFDYDSANNIYTARFGSTDQLNWKPDLQPQRFILTCPDGTQVKFYPPVAATGQGAFDSVIGPRGADGRGAV